MPKSHLKADGSPLDGELRSLVGYRLLRTTHETLLAVTRQLARYDLRRTTFSALSVTVENPGLSPSQLADALAIERPNIVKIVSNLEESALILRKRDPEDRRAFSLWPTDAGIALCGHAYEDVQKIDAELTAGLSSQEITVLKAALERIEINGKKGNSAHG